jgi:hypothetical protein
MNQKFSPGKALLWALGVAAALLVVVVIPAEYGIDWTGAGRALGLTTMGEQKVAAAKAAAAPVSAVAANGSTVTAPIQYATSAGRALRNDSVDVTLPPKGEVEYKAVLAEGDALVYEWDAGGASLTFDFHGEPAAGPQGAFLSFEKGSAAKGAGTLKAPFAGTHGWYWRNQTAATVVIRLKVSGFYTDMKRM